MPTDTTTEALKLAKLSREQASNPFARTHNGNFDIENMQEREGTLRAVHDCYEGIFGKYTDPQPVVKNRPNEYLEQPGRIAVNLLKLFVDLLSVSYDDPPERIYYRKGERVKADDPILVALNKHHEAADYDRFMALLDRWMRLFGNVVARPIFDTNAGQLVYHAYPSYCVRVVPNPINPRTPQATILLGYEYEIDDAGKNKQIPTAEIWSQGRFRFMRDGQVTQDEEFADPTVNYDFVPLVHCFDSPPFGGKGSYYVNSMGWPLAQQNVRFNEDLISQYIYAALMQAIGILVVKGTTQGELIISPGRALHFPDPNDGSGVTSVAQGAMLSDFQNAIDFVLKLIRETYNIPESLLTADVTSSGKAIIQASAPLAEIRKHRQPIFARIETELLRATLQELRGRADGFPIAIEPREWEVALQYPEQQVGMTVTDEIARDKHLLEIGVMTPGDIAMREKPGQYDTREEADADIVANKSKRNAEIAEAQSAMQPSDTNNPDSEVAKPSNME